MEYMNKGIVEIHEALKSGKVTCKELIKESLEKAHEIQEKTTAEPRTGSREFLHSKNASCGTPPFTVDIA